MPNGIFEELADTLRRMETKVDALAEARLVAARPRVASIADLAARYSVSKACIRELLHRMAAAGLQVGTSKLTTEWRVNVAQFDAAYDRLCSANFSAL